jgi:ABC-type nitrate/sulfonate/bicarbonate transport system permease component
VRQRGVSRGDGIIRTGAVGGREQKSGAAGRFIVVSRADGIIVPRSVGARQRGFSLIEIILVVVLTFFAVYNGIRDVDTRLVERVKTLGGGPLVLLREVYIPSVVAWVMGSLKVAVGFAFTGAVVGEFVASSRGLGYLLAFAQSTYNAELTFALIVLVLVFVMMLFGLAGALERHLLRWKYR